MLARHPKRARSPTPPPFAFGAYESSSPLDNVLQKRQRHAYGSFIGAEDSEGYSEDLLGHTSTSWPGINGENAVAGPSITQPGRERRRKRQWEHLNAPQAVVGKLPAVITDASANADQDEQHANGTHANHHTRQLCYPLHSDDSIFQDATASARQAMIEPMPPPLMSSSPIRHTAPTSSPFRSSGTSSQPLADDWDPDELGQAWGEEYGTQNMLLRNLASPPSPLLASRLSFLGTDGMQHMTRMSHHQTPDSAFLMTPAQPNRPNGLRSYSSPTSAELYAAAATENTPSHVRPSYPRANSAASSSLFPTPFRHSTNHQGYPTSSSPFPSHHPFHPLSTPVRGSHEDHSMEEAVHPGASLHTHVDPQDSEVVTRYEEANRLLAELEVARRQRTG